MAVVRAIRVRRLEPIVRDLAKARRDMRPKLRQVAKEFAEDRASAARKRAVSLGGVHRHVAPGIDATSRAINLRVSKHPAIMGAEFGGRGRPRTMQFPPFNPDGYMVYPTLYDPRDPLANIVERLWDDLGL